MRRTALPLILAALVTASALAGVASAQVLREVEVSFSPASSVAEPGGERWTNVTLANTGLQSVTVRLEVAAPADVVAALGASNATLAPGETATIPLRLNVNLTAPDGLRRITVIARDQNASAIDSSWSGDYDLTVQSGPRGLFLQPTSVNVVVRLDKPALFEFWAHNALDDAANLTLRMEAPKGFAETQATLGGFKVAPGEKHRLNVSVTRTADAVAGAGRFVLLWTENGSVAATTEAYFEPASDERDARAPVEEPRFLLEVTPPTTQAEANGVASFAVRVMGFANASFDLHTTNATAGFDAQLSHDGGRVVNGSVHEAQLTVGTPAHAATGYVTVVATDHASGQTQRATVRVDVQPPRPRVELRIDPPEQVGARGEVLRFDFQVSSTHAQTIQVHAANASGTLVMTLAQSTFEVPANGSVNSTVSVRVLSNATSDMFFSLRASTPTEEYAAWALGRVRLQETNETQDDAPPEDAPTTPPPEAPVDEPPADDQAQQEEPPASEQPTPPTRLHLVVVPGEFTLLPGESARGVVRVTTDGIGALALNVSVDVPRGIVVRLDAAPATIAAGTPLDLGFTVSADDDAAPNATHAGTFRASPASDGGAFTVIVGQPPPPSTPSTSPSDSASTSAPPTALAPVFAMAAAGVGASALGLAWARRKWPLAFAALYAKLRPSKVLEHEARKRMADEARGEPGITFGELQRRLGLANGEAAYHLGLLERARILTSARDGQLRRVYPVEMGRVPRIEDIRGRALHLLREQPRTLSALARDLGASKQAVHYHVKRLVESGLVEPVHDGTLRARAAAPEPAEAGWPRA